MIIILLWPGVHATVQVQSGSDLATQSLVPILKVYLLVFQHTEI